MQTEPDIGLKLFIDNHEQESALTGLGGMNMTIDEVLAFFDECWSSAQLGRNRDGTPTTTTHQRIKQKYLEYITENPKAPE
jgi:hypothetical protein